MPFTIRAHSFDVLGQDLARLNLPAIGSNDLFRGVLCFPFMRQRLIDAGFPPHKVFPCNPVIDGTFCATQMPAGRTSAVRSTPTIRPVSDFGGAFSTGGDTPGTFAGISFRSSGSTCIGLLRRGSCS